MSVFDRAYPTIRTEHIANARLFANRFDMFKGLSCPKKRVAEIGVALGDGSKALIEAFTPEEFFAFDLYDLHTVPEFWGKTNKEWFGEKNHKDFYQAKIEPLVESLILKCGDSGTELMKYPANYFDVIYIDGDHTYDGAKKDTIAALNTIRDDGLLIFNDYVMIDAFSGEKYGVVPVVNEVIVDRGWSVVAFALQSNMFCDIALAKIRLPD